jgi:hypothetical protein
MQSFAAIVTQAARSISYAMGYADNAAVPTDTLSGGAHPKDRVEPSAIPHPR